MISMSVLSWLKGLFGPTGEIMELEDMPEKLCLELHLREMAFWSCVNIVANAVSKCEFKTFRNGEEFKGAEYYRWNVSPNNNQSSSVFLHKLVSQLFRNNEALVVEFDRQLLVADRYSRNKYAVVDDVFTGVGVGDFDFRKTFLQSDVLFFQLSEKNMFPVVNAMSNVYRKLIECAMSGFQKSRGMKGILEIASAPAGTDEDRKNFLEAQNRNFRTFADAENAVWPLNKGMSFTELGSKVYTKENTRDIRSMIDDVSDLTAKAFGIPPALVSGKVEGINDALQQFLTFSIDPLVDNIQEEINRKLYGASEYAKGNFLRIETKTIQHIDLMTAPANLDKLISSGMYSVNELRMLMGDPIINEDWAWSHFITKNYGGIEEALNAVNGGEKDGE